MCLATLKGGVVTPSVVAFPVRSPEPGADWLFQVKVLYARNLTQECTEDSLKQAFEVHGKIERVKKIKDYAFIHFEERENALKVSRMNCELRRSCRAVGAILLDFYYFSLFRMQQWCWCSGCPVYAGRL